MIIGFNVRPESRAADIAKQEDVDIRLHSIIYKVEEEIRAAMIGMLDAIEKKKFSARRRSRISSRCRHIGTIAGCRVVDGVIRRQAKARLIRDGVVSREGEHSDAQTLQGRFEEVAGL